MRRKRRWLTQTRHLHMAASYARAVPDEAGMADARASVRMDEINRFLTHSIGATIRFIRWSLSSVQDEPSRHVIPLPGPAHGPVPAIEFRSEAQRRKAS